MQILTSFAVLGMEEIIVEQSAKDLDIITEVYTMLDHRLKIRLDVASATVLKESTPHFVFGAQDPGRLIEIAKGWNQEITETFSNALADMVVAQDYAGPVPVDKAAAQALIGATKEAGDMWGPYSKHGVALEEAYRFHCILTNKELEDICLHPEQCMVVTMDTACRY